VTAWIGESVSSGGAAVRVRRAGRDDWPAVRDLLREADDLHAKIAPEYFRSAPRSDGEWQALLDEDSGAAFVAQPAGAPSPVAVLVARIYDTPDNPMMVPRRRLHIETVVVCGEHRRRGIGRRLMEEAAAWGRGHGAVEVVLTTWIGNDDAEAFYARLGYRVLSRVLSAPL
jgi:ribosomal protein S18 acetylase RimI-like enzyme